MVLLLQIVLVRAGQYNYLQSQDEWCDTHLQLQQDAGIIANEQAPMWSEHKLHRVKHDIVYSECGWGDPELEFTDSALVVHNVPLYEQVRQKYEHWKNIGCNAEVLSWIKDGVDIPPSQPIPNFFQKQITHTPEQLQYWRDKLLPHYISSGAIVEIAPPGKYDAYVSRSFFVEKSSGGFRLVLDLKFVNKFFEFPKVKFENLSVLKNAPSSTTHAFSIDISDAYHHLKVADGIQHFFQFKIDNKFYKALGLPFGWAPAPGIFTKFIRQLLNAVRHPSSISDNTLIIKRQYSHLGEYLVTAFIDDLLGVSTGYYNTLLLAQAVTQLFTYLALMYHAKKCVLTPQTRITHLGFDLDVTNKRFLLAEKQYTKLRTKVHHLLGVAKFRARSVNKRHLAKVVGYCASTCLAIPTGRFHLVSLYHDLHSKDGWSPSL